MFASRTQLRADLGAANREAKSYLGEITDLKARLADYETRWKNEKMTRERLEVDLAKAEQDLSEVRASAGDWISQLESDVKVLREALDGAPKPPPRMDFRGGVEAVVAPGEGAGPQSEEPVLFRTVGFGEPEPNFMHTFHAPAECDLMGCSGEAHVGQTTALRASVEMAKRETRRVTRVTEEVEDAPGDDEATQD